MYNTVSTVPSVGLHSYFYNLFWFRSLLKQVKPNLLDSALTCPNFRYGKKLTSLTPKIIEHLKVGLQQILQLIKRTGVYWKGIF